MRAQERHEAGLTSLGYKIPLCRHGLPSSAPAAHCSHTNHAHEVVTQLQCLCPALAFLVVASSRSLFHQGRANSGHGGRFT